MVNHAFVAALRGMMLAGHRALCAFAIWCAAFAHFAAADEAAQPPLNFVVILVDDLGWRDVGYAGSTFYETPAIDRLARDAVTFTQAYAACPVCSPTRAALVTGRYPARLHLTAHIPRSGIHENPESSPIIVPPSLMQLPREEVTIAERLRAAGYATASIGKWHLGNDPYLPTDQGFDVNFAGDSYGSSPSFFFPYNLKLVTSGREGEYLTDRLTDEALAFLEQHHDQPFFLYLPHFGVHTPIEAKSEIVARYEAKPKPKAGEQHNAHYAAMIESVDGSVDRVLAKLDELGVAERTVVIFTSDNGGLHVEAHEAHYSAAHTPATTNAPLREGKGWLYEGGIRVPLVIRWPGVTEPGSTCDVAVSTVDLFPTILAMARVEMPAGHAIDGESLAPLLDERGELARDSIYWHYPHYNPQGGKPAGAVRSGDYKLIEFYEDDRVELYDLSQDPSETRDLSADEPAVTARLRANLNAWRHRVNAAMPTRR